MRCLRVPWRCVVDTLGSQDSADSLDSPDPLDYLDPPDPLDPLDSLDPHSIGTVVLVRPKPFDVSNSFDWHRCTVCTCETWVVAARRTERSSLVFELVRKRLGFSSIRLTQLSSCVQFHSSFQMHLLHTDVRTAPARPVRLHSGARAEAHSCLKACGHDSVSTP